MSVASVQMDVESDTEGGDAGRPPPLEDRLMVQIGDLKAGSCAVDPEILTKMAELLGMQVSAHLDVLDFVVGRYALGNTDDEWDLTKQLYKGFEGGNLPRSEAFSQCGWVSAWDPVVAPRSVEDWTSGQEQGGYHPDS